MTSAIGNRDPLQKSICFVDALGGSSIRSPLAKPDGLLKSGGESSLPLTTPIENIRWGPSGESGISPDSSEDPALPVRANQSPASRLGRLPRIWDFFRGSRNGFTLIEVLISVMLLSVGLVWILEGYGSVLNTTKRAQFLIEGTRILEEKMVDQELKIRTGEMQEGSDGGREGVWEWLTEVKEIEPEEWYELKGEVRRKGNERTISLSTYVRQ
ncbi:MAG: prepilin-type N-terminal cleavage/methylation domain-containing protein [Deltaproteobacteria bacterium]|nr:prepilin-type N-terminal cleavage/methylation domain-containing protein [Deltaproteobacteria bacterium]